jgi:hypothetical protein
LVILLRRIVHILLLLCLPLYGFAMQAGLPTAVGTTSIIHELDHEDGVHHHHHHKDDGSVHYDESDESLDHAQEHSTSSQSAGVSFSRLSVPAEQLVSELVPYVAQAVPEPFLDGPHRPPASSLGQTAGGMLHT